MEQLVKGHCVPCEGGTQPLKREEFGVYLPQLPNWRVAEDELSISREFKLKNFLAAVDFINRIAKIAEAEGHHPDIFLHHYRNLMVTLTTFAIGGLSINDFVLAAKIDSLLK